MISSWHKDAYFPENQLVVTPSDTVNMQDIRPVYCDAAGDVAVVDKNDTVIVYTVVAGQFLPIKPKRINSTSTTVAPGSLIQIW